MKTKNILLLLSLVSCNKLALNTRNKVLITENSNSSKKQQNKIMLQHEMIDILKKIIEEDKEKEKFISLLKSITEQEYCENVFFSVSIEMLESSNVFYLKEFLNKIENENIQSLYDDVEDTFKRINMSILVENNKLEHMNVLLEFYERKIKNGYKTLLLRFIRMYALYTEPNRDLSVEINWRWYNGDETGETKIKWSDKKIETRINNLINVLKIYKEEDIWNKEDIGKIIDLAIINHKWNAVKIILHFAKEKRINTKDITNIPFIKLLMYYYNNGQLKKENREIPTSEIKEVKEMFHYLIEAGAKLTGRDEEGYALFWKMVTCLTIEEVTYILKIIYKCRGEEELCSVINEISKNGQSVYYRAQKEKRDIYCKLIEGKLQIWNVEIKEVIRKNWEENKYKLTKKAKVEKVVKKEEKSKIKKIEEIEKKKSFMETLV